MRAPLSWIRDFTPVEADAREVAEALDHLGLEVEAIEEPGRQLGGVVVARILDVRPHPNADRARLADIDYGLGEITVVCGAPNIVPGMVVAYAPTGATLPGGITLEAKDIRGIVSEGMLCSPTELGLGEDHSGILALPADTELGLDVREALALDDVVFDLAITPNRPDAMSIVGLARELAAQFQLPFDVPTPSVAEAGPLTGEQVSVVVDAPDRCLRYVARVATVTMGESPAWMARRLTLAGMRPISNVVDDTNYVLLERNQPLHAFDLGRLGGRGIRVRLASGGERLTTLDKVDRTLNAADLVICDANDQPQALAGVMGGGDSEVSATTTSVLIEAAYFEPMGIARTSKRLGLRSESSHWFERGIDPDAVAAGADRCCELLQQIAGATVSPAPLDVYPNPVERAHITIRTDRVNRLLGLQLSATAVRDALEPLGIEVADVGANEGPDFETIAPSWRPDLEREIDLVEEVARRVGLASIPQTLPNVSGQTGGLTPRQRDRRLVADVLVGLGCSEAVTVPLIAPAQLTRLGLPLDGSVEALNSLRADEAILRPAILPGLLAAIDRNAAQGLTDLALFEMGHIFRAPTEGSLLPDERDALAVVFAGTVARRPAEPDRVVDVYDLADAVRALADGLGLASLEIVAGDVAGFAVGRAASLVLDGSVVGGAGEIAADALDADVSVVALELDLDAVLAGDRRDRTFRSPSRFPASNIDLAFVLDERVAAATVRETLRRAGGDFVEGVRVFDEFRAEGLGVGRRSLAFAIRFRSGDRTLTDDEVGSLRQAAIDAVVAAHDAELRG
ncbi:MAG: phenylalanine--tRNA ligase subunit beta [Acidimicrobiia bacterium]